MPRYLTCTDTVLFDSTIDPQTFFVLADSLSYPRINPNNEQMMKDGPINERGIAHGRREIARARLAFVLRPGLTGKKPGSPKFTESVRLINIAPHADPRLAGKFFVLITVAASRKLRGARSGALRAVKLLFFYVREQKIRGGIQVSDELVARQLGWPLKHVRAAKEKLLACGLLKQRQKRRGPYSEAVYEVPAEFVHPDAVWGADRADPHPLDSKRTPYIYPLDIGADTYEVLSDTAQGRQIARLVAQLLDSKGEEHVRALLRTALRVAPLVPAASLLDLLPDERTPAKQARSKRRSGQSKTSFRPDQNIVLARETNPLPSLPLDPTPGVAPPLRSGSTPVPFRHNDEPAEEQESQTTLGSPNTIPSQEAKAQGNGDEPRSRVGGNDPTEGENQGGSAEPKGEPVLIRVRGAHAPKAKEIITGHPGTRQLIAEAPSGQALFTASVDDAAVAKLTALLGSENVILRDELTTTSGTDATPP